MTNERWRSVINSFRSFRLPGPAQLRPARRPVRLLGIARSCNARDDLRCLATRTPRLRQQATAALAQATVTRHYPLVSADAVARNAFLSNLPTDVFGISSTKRTSSGSHHFNARSETVAD